jgi:hypothetical protein
LGVVVVAEQVAGALLFLVPVVVAAIVAFVITRPERPPAAAATVAEPEARVVPLERRSPDRRGRQQSAARRLPAPLAHPTLLHAALSSHLSAVSAKQGGTAAASRAASLSAGEAAKAVRLVSIRRPTRIPRRPSHRCPHQPE